MTDLLTSSEFSRKIDVAPEIVRDWRRRGILDGVGEQTNTGQWRYRLGHVLQLLIAAELVKAKMAADLRHAVMLSQGIQPWVFSRFETTPHKAWTHRYLIAQGEFDVELDTSRLDIRPINEIQNLPEVLENSPSVFHLLIDCERLADRMKSSLPTEILEYLHQNKETGE